MPFTMACCPDRLHPMCSGRALRTIRKPWIRRWKRYKWREGTKVKMVSKNKEDGNTLGKRECRGGWGSNLWKFKSKRLAEVLYWYSKWPQAWINLMVNIRRYIVKAAGIYLIYIIIIIIIIYILKISFEDITTQRPVNRKVHWWPLKRFSCSW